MDLNLNLKFEESYFVPNFQFIIKSFLGYFTFASQAFVVQTIVIDSLIILSIDFVRLRQLKAVSITFTFSYPVTFAVQIGQ